MTRARWRRLDGPARATQLPPPPRRLRRQRRPKRRRPRARVVERKVGRAAASEVGRAMARASPT
eukprot:12699163-Alexandrium_andersonii.AAC.1